jgi:molybdopterin biosynthesis enzyme MoaB
MIVNLPGSPRACEQSLPSLLAVLPHAFEMIEGGGH